MIVIQVLGTSDASTEEQLQAITRDLLDLCRRERDVGGYITFPPDRMQMDLGAEIVALVFGVETDSQGYSFGYRVGEILEKHFPKGTLIGVQVIDAKTSRPLTRKS